jgi:diguanylate cyclase (GGDEF)-like protein
MRLVENSSVLSSLLDASSQELAHRLILAAGCRELGGGREARSPGQAATLLGSHRVQHLTLWHIALSRLEPLAATELVHTAGHAIHLAGQRGLRPCRAISLAIGAPLGWRLLTANTQLSEPLQRVLRDAGSDERAMLERMVFQRTSAEARASFVQEHGVPGELADLLLPPPGSPEAAFREDVRQSMQQGSNDAIDRLVATFASVMDLRLEAWTPPRAPSARDVALAIADLIKDRNVALGQLDVLQSRIAKLEQELALALTPPRGVMGPANTHSALRREVDRARRYKREVSIIALGIDRSTYGVDGDAVLQEIAGRIEQAYRGSDFVGMIDSATLAIVLPETNLAGARIFSERVEHDLRHNPMTHDGCVVALRARLYCSTLAQEKDPTANAVLRTVMLGLTQMDPASRVAWNGSGRLIWRVAPAG